MLLKECPSLHQLLLGSLRNAGSQVPPQTSEVGNGICALTPLPRVSDVQYDFRSTTVENLLYSSISQPVFHRQLVSWDSAVSQGKYPGLLGIFLAWSGECGEN